MMISMSWCRQRAVFAAAIAVTLLTGCAETQLAVHTVKTISQDGDGAPSVAARPVYKIGNPYQVAGIWYHPAEDPYYDEVGLASWYGQDFHGRNTANGDIYDMNALTAAHKTLPMPSRVRVTNLDNGRSLIVTVNDRGPFVRGRIIDVSRRVAQLLGFQRAGLATVRVQAVSEENGIFVAEKPPTPDPQKEITAVPTQSVRVAAIDAPDGVQVAKAVAPPPRVAAQPPPPPRPETVLFVQAGAFRDADNARRLGRALTRFGDVQIVAVERAGLPIYRVRVGPLIGIDDADQTLRGMIDAGYHESRLVVE